MDAVTMFNDGGAFMWPILVCLLAGLTIGLYKLLLLMFTSMMSDDDIAAICDRKQLDGPEAAINHLRNHRSPVAKVLINVLNYRHADPDVRQFQLQRAAQSELSFLEKGMAELRILITLAPMLGFTGTVFGMIMAFANIKAEQDITPAVVAEGIEVALLTTLFGLVTAMIIQLIHHFFQARIDLMENRMGEAAAALMPSTSETTQLEEVIQ